MKDGKGNITVNKKSFDEYFTVPEYKYQILRPFS
ncbi:MAG: 30S ribosomal protein S9, partial [Bacteroidales bacterium]|nr:30S ribosomal protein S9 [Bacteroidales bacterium]